MSAAGRSNKTLRVQTSATCSLTKPGVKRLAHKAGILRHTPLIRQPLSQYGEEVLFKLVSRITEITLQSGRKTVSLEDTRRALRLMGCELLGSPLSKRKKRSANEGEGEGEGVEKLIKEKSVKAKKQPKKKNVEVEEAIEPVVGETADAVV